MSLLVPDQHISGPQFAAVSAPIGLKRSTLFFVHIFLFLRSYFLSPYCSRRYATIPKQAEEHGMLSWVGQECFTKNGARVRPRQEFPARQLMPDLE
jgi:hypothetical protein